jgi:predicted MFS family arabinose efflux permease
MAFNLGFTISPALGGILAGELGWHWLFWADGITCIAAAFALRFFLKPGKVVNNTAHNTPENNMGSASPYKNRPFLAFTLLTFVGAVVFMQIVWTVPIYFKDVFHWGESQIGLAMALNGAIVFLVEMPLIFFVEGRRSVLSFVRIGLILYILSYLSFFLPLGTVGAAILYMFFISLGEIMVMPFSSNFAYAKAEEQKSKGQYMAMYGIAYSLANIIAPLLGTQIIAAWGYHMLWSITIGLSAVALAGFFWLDRRLSRTVSKAIR